jgi:hypothetical protein
MACRVVSCPASARSRRSCRGPAGRAALRRPRQSRARSSGRPLAERGAGRRGPGRTRRPRAPRGSGTAAAGTCRSPRCAAGRRRARGRCARPAGRPRPVSRAWSASSTASSRHRTRTGTWLDTCSTNSKVPAGSAASSARPTTPRRNVSKLLTTRGVKDDATTLRSWVCRGGSVSIRDVRWASCSSSSSSSATPRLDVKVCQSRLTATMSACRDTDQNPLCGAGSGVQATGGCRGADGTAPTADRPRKVSGSASGAARWTSCEVVMGLPQVCGVGRSSVTGGRRTPAAPSR